MSSVREILFVPFPAGVPGESGQVSAQTTHVVGSAALTGENGSVTVSRLTAGQLVAKGYGGTVVVKDATVRRDATLVKSAIWTIE